LPALACALLVSACGGEERPPAPKLPAAVAQELAQRSDAVADRLEAGDSCGARSEADALQSEAVAAVNERRIPQRFQEELLGTVAALAESIECMPPVVEDDGQDDAEDDDKDKGEDDDDDGKGKGQGQGKGKGKGKKNGKGKG
jgi:hypothetical protein